MKLKTKLIFNFISLILLLSVCLVSLYAWYAPHNTVSVSGVSAAVDDASGEDYGFKMNDDMDYELLPGKCVYFEYTKFKVGAIYSINLNLSILHPINYDNYEKYMVNTGDYYDAKTHEKYTGDTKEIFKSIAKDSSVDTALKFVYTYEDIVDQEDALQIYNDHISDQEIEFTKLNAKLEITTTGTNFGIIVYFDPTIGASNDEYVLESSNAFIGQTVHISSFVVGK